MTPSERETLLSLWIKPSSDDEVTQQERALRMVDGAINASNDFRGVSKQVYAKGSYANNTNVRRDSDVDIVAECRECAYWDYQSDVPPQAPGTSAAYQGPWDPATWRSAVVSALKTKFGADQVDTSGKIAINVAAVAGSRPSIDIVPSFEYRRYLRTDKSLWHEGSCVFPTAGPIIINWPQQQLDNGRSKNDATGKRYKNFVRALKNAENALVKKGAIEECPSYFMECLMYRVENPTLKTGNLSDGFRESLRELYHALKDPAKHQNWVEPNHLKWLFRGDQKWTAEQGRLLVLETWKYLDYS